MAPADAPTPLGFDVVRHGFDRTQVTQHIMNLESNLRLLTSDRDNALAQVAELNVRIESLHSEVAKLRDRADATLAMRPATTKSEVYEELRVLVDVTRAEAKQITARAQASAEQTFASVQKASAALRNRYETLVADLEAQESQLKAEHEAAFSETKTQIERMAAEAEQRRSRFGEQAEQQHRQVEQEFAAAMAARQAALDKEVADRKSASEAQAAKVLADANADAERRTKEADRKVTQLTTLRQRVSERLRETGELLTKSSTLLEPQESEAEIVDGTPPPQQQATTPMTKPAVSS
jgi:colicin import membrane protein